MRRLLILVLAVLAVLSGCSSQRDAGRAVTDKRPAPEPNPVASVVNAAADYFYVKDNGLDKDWSEGDFVVFAPEWNVNNERSFNELMKAMLGGDVQPPVYTVPTVSKEKAPIVQRILDDAGDEPPSRPIEVPALKDLALHKRIVLEELTGRGYWREDYVNREGKKGTGRAVGSVMRPVFSNNGRYALVVMNIRWSVHSGPVVMLLENRDEKWEVVYSDYTIFL
jgi:hypothetical protein